MNALEILDQNDPENLQNIVLEHLRMLQSLQQKFLDIGSLSEITPNLGVAHSEDLTVDELHGHANAMDINWWLPLTLANDDVTSINCLTIQTIAGIKYLYVGGVFNRIGGVDAVNIARYSFADRQWYAVNGGVNNIVNVITFSPAGVLHIGGGFTNAGGDALADRIAKDDGAGNWVNVNGGVSGAATLYSIVFSPAGVLHIGGSFSNASADPLADNIAKDDGAGAWVNVNGGVNDEVYSMAYSASGVLHIGGLFLNASADPLADHIAKDDGAGAWVNVNGGVNERVLTVAFNDDDVCFIGGVFQDASGDEFADYIAKDGGAGAWVNVGGGLLDLGGVVYKITFDNDGNPIAGGIFEDAGEIPEADRIAVLVDDNWQALSNGGGLSGLGGFVYSVVVDPDTGTVYAAGDFDTAGTIQCASIAAFVKPLGDALDMLAGLFEQYQAAATPSAPNVSYTPAVLADWDGGVDPGDVDDALDQLAGRITDAEGIGIPGGSDTQIQFNDGGTAFGGSSDLTWDDSGKVMTVNGKINGVNLYGDAALNIGIGGNVYGSLDPVEANTNLAIGEEALAHLTTGDGNFALGANVLHELIIGNANIGIGYWAGRKTLGDRNIAIGSTALGLNENGSDNVVIGVLALESNEGSRNIAIGNFAGQAFATESDTLIVDNRSRATAAITKTNAIIYGVMAATPENQTINFNVGSTNLPAGATYNINGSPHGHAASDETDPVHVAWLAANRTANTFPAGPAVGAAAPLDWRALVAADIGAGIVAPASLANASAQYKYLVSGATPFAYAESVGELNIASGKTLTISETLTLTALAASQTYTFPAVGGTVALLATANVFTAEQTITATADVALSAEYITDVKNRDFSAATDWAGTNWKIPLLAVAQANDITVAATGKTFTRTAGSFLTDGFQVGMSVTWSGFAKAGTLNNGTFVISTVTALVMTCSTATLSDEIPADYVACSATSPVWSHAVAGANAATLASAKLTAAPANGDCFQIIITVVTKTANSLNVTIGSVSMNWALGKVAGTQTAYTFDIFAASASVLTITPGATWLGWIDDISVKKVTLASVLLTGKLLAGTSIFEVTPSVDATSIGAGLSALKGSSQISCTAFGSSALYGNTGTYCTAFGQLALDRNTATKCTAVGYQAGAANFGINNVAVGYNAQYQSSSYNSVAIGNAALYQSSGAGCVAVGADALNANTGSFSIGIGNNAGLGNTGESCIAIGFSALNGNTGGSCAAIGDSALRGNTAGGNNALGLNAGRYIADGTTTRTTGTTSLFLGNATRALALAQNNQIVIGDNAIGAGANSVTLGNTSIINTVLRGTVGIAGLGDRIQLQVTGFTTQAVATALVSFIRNDVAAGVSRILCLTALGSGAAGDGLSVCYSAKSSTTADTQIGLMDARWVVSTHASRTGAIRWYVNDAAGARLGLQIEASGAAAMIGFLGATAIVQPVNTVAIDTALVNLGLRATGGYANFDTTIKPRAGTAAANTSPIIFTSGALLGTPEVGAFEFYDGRFYITGTGKQRAIDRTSALVNVADVIVGNVDTLETLYTWTLSAGAAKIGRIYKLHLDGAIENESAADDVTLIVYFGADIVATINPAMGATSGSKGWHMDFNFTIRTLGNPGTGTFHGHTVINTMDTMTIGKFNPHTVSANDVTVKAQWDNAKSGNIFTLYQAFLEFKN